MDKNSVRIFAAGAGAVPSLLKCTPFMHSRWLYYFTLCVVASASGHSYAQESQIQQARQLEALNPGPVQTAGGLPTDPILPSSGEDADSFGVQQLLREAERLRLFRAFLDVSAFVTNNVALARKSPTSDAFLLATFGFECRRPLPHGFQLDASLRLATFRYNENSELDFSSVDAGAGVSYHADKLGGVDFFARYNFNELIGTKTEDVFFKNHTVTLGAQKVIPFSQAHYAYFGVSGQIGFADPKEAERSDLSAYGGYHVQATRNLDVDLLYRYSYLSYSKGPRADRFQTLSLALHYRFTDWFSVSASTFSGWNRSNRNVFDYNSANVGGGLTLSLQF